MWLYLRSPCLCTSSGGVDQKSVWKCQGSGQHWSPSRGSRCGWTWRTSCRIWKWSWKLRRPENQRQFVKTRHGCFWSIIWDIGVFQFLCISAAQFAWQSAQKPLKLFKLSKGKQTSIFCNGNVFCQIVLGPKAMKMYFFALFGRCFTCCNWWKCDRNAFAKTHFWQKTCYGHGIHTRCGSTALQDVSIFSRILLLWWKNPTRLCTTANDRSFVLICDTGGK